MDHNRLFQGDCIEGLGRLAPESAELVFADPPFNIGYDYDVYQDDRGAENYLDWTRRWGAAVVRVLKPTGTFWLAIGDEYAAELKLVFQRDLGLSCRSWVIWYYTFGVNCTRKFSRSHAHLFHFVKDAASFTFNDEAIRVPSARQLVYDDRRANAKGRLPDDTWVLRPQDVPEGFGPDADTWYFSRVCGTFKERAGWHGCQMPEQLLGRIIRVSSNPGDLVVDPFAGSATTLVAAKKLGRRWLGFELSPNYVAQAEARLARTVVGEPLEGAPEPTVSAPRTPRPAAIAAPAVATVSAPAPLATEEIRRAILEAFFVVRDGFSADRVIADPSLNDRFLAVCRRFGVPGESGDWNRQLLNLRKAGHLKGLPRPRSAALTKTEIDQCGFACEIAIAQLCLTGRTVDQILCEPAEAVEFDRLVRSVLSTDIASFPIRWVALHLRKQAKAIRAAGQELQHVQPLPMATPMTALDWDRIPAVSGLYWLESPTARLYVGETLDLRQRFHRQFVASRFSFWNHNRRDLVLRYCALEHCDERTRKGQQARWIAEWQPLGNYREFAARPPASLSN